MLNSLPSLPQTVLLSPEIPLELHLVVNSNSNWKFTFDKALIEKVQFENFKFPAH